MVGEKRTYKGTRKHIDFLRSTGVYLHRSKSMKSDVLGFENNLPRKIRKTASAPTSPITDIIEDNESNDNVISEIVNYPQIRHLASKSDGHNLKPDTPKKDQSKKRNKHSWTQPQKVTDMSFPGSSSGLSKSRTEKFHKLFKSVPETEYPIDYFSCAYIGDILLQGNLYVSQNWFCFYSRIRGRGRLQEIPMNKVISITREKTALIFPNAIGFQTAEDKYAFGSFITRDNTYRFLVSIWKKSQEIKSEETETKSLTGTPQHSRSSTTSSTGQEYMFSADNPDSEFDNQNLSQNAQNLDNQSHSTSRTESVNQSEDDLCPDCEALDSGEPDTGEENSFISSHDKQGTIIRKGDSQQGTIIRKRDCRHVSKERSIGHARRKDLETRQLGFPYSVINSIPIFLGIDRQKTMRALKNSAMKLQRIPRTNLLLAICTIFVMFLLISAVALTYKILDLEAKLQARSLWTADASENLRQRSYNTMFGLQSAAQSSTAHHILTVLRANIQILEEIYSNLRGLKDETIRADKRFCDAASCHDNP